MTVTVTVAQAGGIVAEITTGREDIAAQLVYETVKTAMQDDCGCEDVCMEDMRESIVMSFGPTAEDLEGLDPDDEDPNYYSNRNNGYTIEESAQRATDKVVDILSRESSVSPEEVENIIYPEAYVAISHGIPRSSLYSIAGTISKEFRDYGYYVGLPLTEVFKYKVGEHIDNTPETV